LKFFLVNYFNDSYNNGFINISSEKLGKNELTVQIRTNQRMILQSKGITDKTKFSENAQELISKQLPAIVHPLALEIITRLNIPNLLFSKDLTDKTIELAMQSVSKTIGIVREGEIIIKNGEKLSKENIAKIRSYQSSRYMTSDTTLGVMFYLGSFGHAALVMSLLFVYLIVLRKRIYEDNVKLVIIMLILIITSLLSWSSTQIDSEYPLEYLIFIPSFSMLAAIVFDSRTAFMTNVTMALLLAGIRGNDYITGTTMIFTGMIAAYTVRDIQNRTQMYQSIFFIFLSFSLCIIIFGAERSLEGVKFFQSLLMASIGAIISPLITFGLLFIIERTTNIATDLRIKEFDNLDHPLLRKLAESSPGTYQHTISVAVLAERCAREIEANPLLTKVGSYFHDIGKLVKPEYFTENQIGLENKHDLISPRKSAKIIIEHVQEGIDLANQYKIPQRIIDFIPMHHGTSFVKHFYAKALEESAGKEINPDDFRYPGPKPKTKESAILMICDSAEAISRLDALTLEATEKIIDTTIKDKISDGQFDECNITLDELNKVKQTIAKNLIGMTHKRVSYKEIPKK
jgi:putative nucleotidyltransferase with HDIG domain